MAPEHYSKSKRIPKSRKEKAPVQTAPAQEGLGRIGRTKESKGRISGDLGRRRPVALRRREKGILRRGFKISFGEQQRIALDHPSVHDHFGSTMARPERKRYRISITGCLHGGWPPVSESPNLGPAKVAVVQENM